jgi:hypothetical protein
MSVSLCMCSSCQFQRGRLALMNDPDARTELRSLRERRAKREDVPPANGKAA